MPNLPLDTHKQIAAWLAIAAGVINLLVILIVVAFFGGIAMFISDDQADGILSIICMVLFIVAGFFAILDIIAGIYYMRGSRVAEVWLVISNILFLFGFPIGTVIGAYSLWAILRSTVPPQNQGA